MGPFNRGSGFSRHCLLPFGTAKSSSSHQTRRRGRVLARSGVAAGVLIALGPRARLPVAAGAIVATILANLMGDRTLFGAVVFGLCNAGEALLTAWLIEHYFGLGFNLGKLSHVLGMLVCAIAATADLGNRRDCRLPILSRFEYADSDYLAALVRVRCPRHHYGRAANHSVRFGRTAAAIAARIYRRRRRTHGAGYPEWTCHFSAAGILRDATRWRCCFPRSWLSVAASSVFEASPSSVHHDDFNFHQLGDASLPISERVLGAQASILAVSFCVFVLVALFAERRLHELELVAGSTRLHAALTELRLLYENAPIGLAFVLPIAAIGKSIAA